MIKAVRDMSITKKKQRMEEFNDEKNGVDNFLGSGDADNLFRRLCKNRE